MKDSNTTTLTVKEIERARENERRIKGAALRIASKLPNRLREAARDRIFEEMDQWHAETYFFTHGVVIQHIRGFLLCYFEERENGPIFGLGVEDIVKLMSHR
jgi:hypothetical protein